MLRRDIELAQALGFNGARKHQKVEDPRWLYWADKLGFLVWSEMPSFHQHSPEAERRLAAEWTEVVRRDRDHPSVVTWVVANESFGLGEVDPSVRSSFLVRLYTLTRDLDGTRPVVSNDGWEHALTDLCPIHDYSPPDVVARRYRTVDLALEQAADRPPAYDPGYAYRGEPMMVTEFGGLRISGPAGWGWLEAADDDEARPELRRDIGHHAVIRRRRRCEHGDGRRQRGVDVDDVGPQGDRLLGRGDYGRCLRPAARSGHRCGGPRAN